MCYVSRSEEQKSFVYIKGYSYITLFYAHLKFTFTQVKIKASRISAPFSKQQIYQHIQAFCLEITKARLMKIYFFWQKLNDIYLLSAITTRFIQIILCHCGQFKWNVKLVKTAELIVNISFGSNNVIINQHACSVICRN